MATVKRLKEYLDNLDLNEKLYIGYSDDDEWSCEIITEEDIIERVDEVRSTYEEDEEDRITDIDSALVYLADMNAEYHYMELEL